VLAPADEPPVRPGWVSRRGAGPWAAYRSNWTRAAAGGVPLP